MRSLSLLVAGCVLACSAPYVADPRPTPPPEPKGAVLRWQQRKGESDRIPDGSLYRATVEHQARLAALPENAGGPTNWTLLGPGNIGGRIRSILIDPQNPQRMWVGSVGGGVWRSLDAGGSWTMQPDLPAVLAVACMIMHPNDPNTIWAGTGEQCFFSNVEGSSNSAVQQGAGVFKTTDGGNTWTQLPATAGPSWNSVSRLTIDRNNPLVMVASTISGIWRSTDGGNTWSQRTTVKTLDVKIDPNNSNNYVAGRADGIAQYSTNGGVTWSNAPSFASTTRVELAYARSSPGVVYAATSTSGSLRVWRSTNGGQTWVQQTGSGVVSTLGNYDSVIWVDPTNSARVLLGGLDIYRSTNSGVNFTKISAWASYPSSAHADQHAIVEHPTFDGVANNTVFFGNDGGIQRASNVFTVSNTSGWTNLANGLAITQFYGVAMNPISGVVMAGAQDNGTSRGTSVSGINGWTQPGGGDGTFCATDPTDQNYFYFQSQHLAIRRSTNGGTSSSSITSGISDSNTNFAAYILLDPNDSNRMYACGSQLWRTNTVKGATPLGWTSVKPALSCTEATPPGPRPDHYLDNWPCGISTVAVAMGNSNIVWVGHNNGDVYRSANALSGTPTWTRVDTGAPGLPNRWVSRIAIDHADHTKVTVSLMGYARDNVWRTTDNGATWTPRLGTSSAPLPAVPVSCIVQHRVLGSRYYIATDLGLYYSEDDTQSWLPAQGGPTIVMMDELVWKNDRTLVVATHGRSVWTCDVDPASVSQAGRGCGILAVPSLVATAPVIGSSQTYTLSGASPNGAVTLLVSPGLPNPTTIGPCTVQPTLPALGIPFGTTSGSGTLVANLAIPANPSLVGALVTAQEVIVAIGGPLLGVAELSNGLEMTLGF